VKEHVRSTTLFNELRVLKTMFARAKEWGLYEGDNPVKKLPKTFRKKIAFLSAEEVERYLASCSTSYLPIAATFIFTGMRKGELLDLRWSDVDLKKKMISIRSDLSRKNSEGRDIPINNQLSEVLKRLPKTSEYVFPGADGISQRNCFKRHHLAARIKTNLPNSTSIIFDILSPALRYSRDSTLEQYRNYSVTTHSRSRWRSITT